MVVDLELFGKRYRVQGTGFRLHVQGLRVRGEWLGLRACKELRFRVQGVGIGLKG